MPAPAISAAWSRTRCSSIASSGSSCSASSTIARSGDHIGYRGLPLLGTLDDVDEIIRRERIDHLYVALPLEEHVKMLGLVEVTNREGVDLHVVPDLLQFIALRARLENLDGVPIISLNDVPLRGFNSLLKRCIDVGIAGSVLVMIAPMFGLIAWLIRRTSGGPVFYEQERMGLDGKAFQVLKFRSMYEGAEDETGPIWARDNDPALHAGRPLAAPLRSRRAAAALERRSAATCRSSDRAPSARISSSSSSTASRSTCCGTR